MLCKPLLLHLEIGEGLMILLLYVNNMLIMVHDMMAINKLKEQLIETFEMKDLGVVRKILGIKIMHDKKSSILELNQQDYVKKVLTMFSMQGAKPMMTPLASQFKLSNSQLTKMDKELDEM